MTFWDHPDLVELAECYADAPTPATPADLDRIRFATTLTAQEAVDAMVYVAAIAPAAFDAVAAQVLQERGSQS